MPSDHSQLATFQQCPEKFRLRYLERLERLTDQPDDQPKQFGKALHAGLAAWYHRQWTQVISDRFLSLWPKPLVEGEKLYTPQNGLQILQQYLQQYGEQEKSYKVLAVETPITIELNDETTYLVKLDTVLEDTNGVWVLEHKSTASPKAFTDKWWEQFEPNSQLSGQVAACQQQYGRCDGIILNGIAFSYGVRKGFTVEFQRQIFTRTDEQLKDWRYNTLRILNRLADHLPYPDIQWEKHESMCAWCSYRPICLSCGSQGVREAMYRVRSPEEVLAYQQEG